MSDFNNELFEKIKLITSKIEGIEKKQKEIENKLNQIYNSILGIENDIYEDEFELEINCPYCNTEFVADVESKSEIKCPECQNTIELDWNGGDEQQCCMEHCSGCSSKCGESFLEEFGDDINIIDDDDSDM